MKQADSIDERIKALCEALTGFTQGQDDGALKALANDAPDDALGRLALAIDAAVRPVRAPHSAVARAYFDYALNGIIETDYAGRILQANPAACSITGVRRVALIGMRFADLLDTAAGNQDATQKHFALVHEQGIHRSEVMLREQNPTGQTDQTRIIEIASIDVGTEKLLHVFDDVTEQRQLLLDIEAARQAAEEANKAKGNFLANMSHEIRTPLNGVIGLTQLALMTALTPQQEDYLKNIYLSSRHLLTMLNDLLDFSKIEAGRVDYEQIPFSLDEVLDELAPPAAQAARGKALELVFQIGADVPRHLVGDRLRLSQVLSNLLNNAIKFTAAGKVVLSLHSLPVVSRDACVLRICVWDTGIGISANELARLFQPFSQADVSTTRRFGGTGLGLAITKMLVEGMRGKISVVSSPGSGSEFIVTLPFVAEMQAGTVSRQALPDVRRALVIGSKPVTYDAVRDMLAAEGYAAVTARQDDAQGAPDLNDLIVIDYDAVLAPDTTLASLFKRHPNLLILVDLETFAAIGPTLAMPAAVELLVKPVAPEALRRALYRLRSKAALPQMRAVAAVQAPQEFAGATILVAEDNRINQQVIGDLLRHAGIHVRLANNGIEAVAAVEQMPPPDLILMDVQMPDMDGLVATRLLRTGGVRLPIVGLSAGVSREEQDRCMTAGMSDFLGKPIDVDELWGVLTRWLPARRHTAPQTSVATASTAMPTLAGIDMDDALPRFLNNFDSLHKTLQLFNAEHGDTAARLQQLHAQADWQAIAMLLHSVKGASGLLGAKAVAALAKSLEEELRLGRHAAMPPLIDALRAALAVLV